MALEKKWLPTNFMRTRAGEENADVARTAASFRDRFEGEEASVTARKQESTTLVNEYYDLVTDFYEYGWGQSFHFAGRFAEESFFDSLARHEYFLAAQGHFKAGDHVLDIGCGVGGPLRNVVRFSGANVTGVNNNAYQIRRAKRYDDKLKLSGQTNYVRCDFNSMPFENNSVDGAYAIEAICHSCDKVRTYKEIFRVMKPGARFVSYEWLLTAAYNEKNAEHRRIRHQIELGNALPTLDTAEVMLAALKEAGFEIVDHFDVVERFDSLEAKTIPWYEPLSGGYTTLSGLRASPIGRWMTTKMVRAMEVCRLAPKGTTETANILEEAAIGLVKGGEQRFFTPAHFFCVRKPL